MKILFYKFDIAEGIKGVVLCEYLTVFMRVD